MTTLHEYGDGYRVIVGHAQSRPRAWRCGIPSSAGSELVAGEFIPALVAKTRTDAKGQGRSPLLCAELPRISLGSVSPAIVAAQLHGVSPLFANLPVGNLSTLLRAGFIYPDSGMELRVARRPRRPKCGHADRVRSDQCHRVASGATRHRAISMDLGLTLAAIWLVALAVVFVTPYIVRCIRRILRRKEQKGGVPRPRR